MTTKIAVWPKGYPDERGLAWIEVDDNTRIGSIKAAVYERFGATAVISHIVDVRLPAQVLTEADLAYARAMTKGDNT